MIIDKDRMLDFHRFASGLQTAARGVGRLSTGSPESSFCCAWLVTPDLIVAPDFAVNVGRLVKTAAKYFFYLTSATGKVSRIEALVLQAPIAKVNPRPGDAKGILLRLKKPVKRGVLSLEMHSLREDDQLYVLHYPAGYADLQLSIGKVNELDNATFHFDADTQSGSGGAPILDIYGTVIGMHVGRGERLNIALKLDDMLRFWQHLPEWKEIAAWHRIALLTGPDEADGAASSAGPGTLPPSPGAQAYPSSPAVPYPNTSAMAPYPSPATASSSPSPAADGFLIREALLWTSDPAEIPEENKKQLLPLVVNVEAPVWSLRTDERLKIIRSVGALQVLRAARGKGGPDHPAQKVIDRILEGGPFKMEEISDAVLPYWLQIVRWFTDVLPDLPAPAEISREMEKRRTRSRLTLVAGADFRGRQKELDELRNWYRSTSPGAMVISGIGGIGKSALVSRFALDLPERTLIWWLDFDRADIAPDDAFSMLTVLVQQADVQMNGIEQPVMTPGGDWKEVARLLSSRVAEKVDKDTYPVLILDGFEVAQQVRRYNELWPVLEVLMESLPLRVIVSGRAPVLSLQLAGRKASDIDLKGMDPVSAREWLRLHKIEDPEVVEKVLEMSRGIPLILKLAARLVEAGEDVKSLPRALPGEIQDGFLYQRILNRVIDPILQPVAKDVLVVRRLSKDMLQEVFADRLPKDVSVDTVFSSLMNEMGLVEEEEGRRQGLALAAGNEPDELRIRSEVRLATLRLLEKDDAARVAEIDRRVADWYVDRPGQDIADQAESIYHYLRVGDIPGAQKLWTGACIPFLTNAPEEMPAGREDAKAWLQSQLRTSSDLTRLGVWEKDALMRIQDAASRSLKSSMLGILEEKKERTEGSPLLIYDAWAMAEAGNLPGARAILQTMPSTKGEVQDKRYIVQAMLAWYDNDNRAAERALCSLDLNRDESLRWTDEQLLIRTARIGMTEDLVRECGLYSTLEQQPDHHRLRSALESFFIKPDIILPDLRSKFINYRESSASNAYSIPFSEAERKNFVTYLENYRQRLTKNGNWRIRYDDHDPLVSPGGAVAGADWEEDIANAIEVYYREEETPLTDALALAGQAMRRWVLATRDLFLAGSLEFVDNPQRFSAPECYLAILMSWYTLSGQEMIIGRRASDRHSYTPDNFADYYLSRSPYKSFALAPSARACATALRVLDTWKEKDDIVHRVLDWLHEDGLNSPAAGLELYSLITSASQHLRLLLLYILGPQPLEVLYYRALGIPFNKPAN